MHGADRVARDLTRDHVSAQAIHGNKSQNARQRALSDFKSKSTRVLVATDIAARGIDIDGLNYVVNFDLPEVPETYIHRIGRSGRAGNLGTSLSFCDFEEKKLLKDIEKLITKPIPVIDGHPYPLTVTTIEPKQTPVVRQPRQLRQPRQPAEQASQPSGSERPLQSTQQHRSERSSLQVQTVQTERRPQSTSRPSANRPQERQPYAPARNRQGR